MKTEIGNDCVKEKTTRPKSKKTDKGQHGSSTQRDMIVFTGIEKIDCLTKRLLLHCHFDITRVWNHK